MPPDAISAKLAKLKREVQRELRPLTRQIRLAVDAVRRPRGLFAEIAIVVLEAGAIVALPFLVYVRASVELYARGVTPWLAVACGALLTMGVVVGYAAWLSRRHSGRARLLAAIRWVALPTVAAWCAFAVFHLSSANVKSDDVRRYFSEVHPVLRVALATAILADQSMVVTDLGRVPADYSRMGLPVNDRTKHYRQANGWVHAVDLRTHKRGEIRNRVLQFYFWTMGFDTLRHVGTADHLHVQLAVR